MTLFKAKAADAHDQAPPGQACGCGQAHASNKPAG